MRIMIVNGPNLNLLGKREPEIYGTTTLWDIEKRIAERFPEIKFEWFQSNCEGTMIDTLQKAMEGDFDAVIVNPGAYTHYSYAIRDALAALKIPVVEVHLTNIYAREEFRQHSITAGACRGVISGFGVCVYELAVHALIEP
ncbi:MAG: type II 3-dehydroquinate dehydratase [bacterium]